MLNAISSAQKSIFWESYIMADDVELDYNFFEVLEKKAKDEVKVKIVIDGFGSLELSNATREKLKKTGAEICAFRSWFRHVHRKILIVDGKIAFLGGVNVGKKYNRWLDLHVRLTGRHIVSTLTKSFARSYFYCGGLDSELLAIREKSSVRKTELWLLEHFPFTGRFMLKRYYQEKIALAQRKIFIVTPYFIPHGWLVKSLANAVNRGVKVDVIIPGEADSGFMNFANYLFAETMSKTGINFYLTKEMIHAKALLVDDKIGLVGSNNIDALSFDWNSEASVSFEKKEMVDDLKMIIADWIKNSEPFDGQKLEKHFYYKFLAFIVKLIQPVM